MTTDQKSKITIQAKIAAPINQVWTVFNDPRHIVKWNSASPDWHSPKASNELEPGGSFSYRMEAKDGSFGFDFTGVFQKVIPNELLSYVLDDGREVEVIFFEKNDFTELIETFEAESSNSIELQKQGWQAILDNFKSYIESLQTDSLHFEIEIQAPVKKVFSLMIASETYQEWTSAFSPTSHYVGTWEKGSKIQFLSKTENGNLEGMVSRIADMIPNKYVSIEHLGFVSNGEEITTGPKIEPWAGAHENYSFYDLGEKTLLKIDMETGGEYRDYFLNTWPIALEKLKEICER